MADYVVATKMALEVPGFTRQLEPLRAYEGQCMGHSAPYAMYSPAVVGSDLLEEWELFMGLAEAMNVELHLGGGSGPLGASAAWTTDTLLELLSAGARVPLSEVRRHPHGVVMGDPDAVVMPADRAVASRLDVGNPQMMAALAALGSAHEHTARVGLPDEELTHLLISRRSRDVVNSTGSSLTSSGARRHNPAFMNPADLAALGLASGDEIVLESRAAAIPAIVEPADDVLPGTISMSHAWGGGPDQDDRVREIGSNTSRLISRFDEPDPWCATPRMSAVPVRVRATRTESPDASA
jgi:anaerobic selenocysteine-containing dehydrogenase